MEGYVKMKIPSVSVIIITYNGMQTLPQALNCMIGQNSFGQFSFEIIVIDDGSTDETNAYIEKTAATVNLTEPIRYFRTAGKGISFARNMGIAKSDGDWIAFFDQDQLAEPTWISELLTVALQNNADVVDGPRRLAMSQAELYKLSSTCREALGEIEGSQKVHQVTTRTCSCTGNVLINRRVFDTVGGFDETIVQGGEDWHFFRKVRAAGFDIWYAPQAVVHHIIPAERLTKSFFKLTSLRCGHNFAYRDYKEWGISITVLLSISRVGQALFLNIPCLIWATIWKKEDEMLGRKCLLWKAVGFTRKTLFLLSPRFFTQKRFSNLMILRRE
jgi:glycosyltransferase involved in cell wall biosynthesis